MRKNRRKLAALAVVVLGLGGVGIAFAYWTSTGAGSGSASVGTSTNWAVTTDAATGGPLTPGGPSEAIAYHVKNNNTGHQNLASVAISIANSDGSPWIAVAGCSKSDFSINGGLAGATATDAPGANLAGGAQHNGSVSIQMVDTGSDQNACRNATVPLYLYAS
jgi:hypothetical protein